MKEAEHSVFRFAPAWACQTNQKCRKSVVDAFISNRAGLLAKPRLPHHRLHRHRLHHWSGSVFSPPLFRPPAPPFWRRAPCPASFTSSVGEISCPSFCPAAAPIRPRRGGMPLPHAACLGAHTVANCWLQPQLHQTASEARYCGARTFAAFSPMAPALPHTTKQCTRARRRPFSAWWLQRLSRDCAGLRSPRFVLTVLGAPWHRSRYPKQTVAYNIQGTPNLYVDGLKNILPTENGCTSFERTEPTRGEWSSRR